MAKNLLLGIFLLFFALVGFNYLFTLAGNFRALGGLSSDAGLGSPGHALAAVNFVGFGKNGTGRGYITQGYGHTPFSAQYPDAWHDGIDIAAAYGAPIYPPTTGVVLATGNQDDYCWRRGFGMYVAVYDPTNDVVLWFAHLGTIDVSPGEKVATSTRLGVIGSTGFETGTHLHFSIFQGRGFSMAGLEGCGPGPTTTDRDLDPMTFLGSTYQ